MVKTASTKPSVYTHKKTTTKIGVVEVGQDFYQSIERLLCSDFEVFSIGFRDILFNNIDIGEYRSILVYYGIKYEAIDISATLDLITIIKNFSTTPPAILLITDYADSQITAESRSYLPQIDGVFAKDQDLVLLLKILKIVSR
jgi:hypothetical protein